MLVLGCSAPTRGTVCFWMGVGTRYFMRVGSTKLSATNGGTVCWSSAKSRSEGTCAAYTATSRTCLRASASPVVDVPETCSPVPPKLLA
jgi:hypothetical protein